MVTCFLVTFGCLAGESESKFVPPEMHVPNGFVVEVVAAPPLVEYPMMGCLDELGRLYLAESRGRNLDKNGLLAAKHRFIRMLEDTDGDGTFDKSTIFADGLVMPEGAVWYRGSLYVLSSPYLWRFRDTDGDGVADEREKLVGEMEFNGKANQHGAYLGPCGRLYFSGGIFGYDLTGSDGKPAYPVNKGTAPGVFSCRPDGSDVEIFATGGINPVEVVFSPEGELFTTCPIIDTIDGRHDALIHWVRGATAGPTDFRPPPLPQTGYRLPPLIRWGQVAPSGLMMYRGDALGSKYQGRLFATHFNTRSVVTAGLARFGSTYRSVDEQFLTSPNSDFHPTDIMEDADGSLLLIDTGGWFNISCPFSEMAKPEIPGAVYRIRRSRTEPEKDPRGLSLNWSDPSFEELFARLGDVRPFVRDRAVATWHALGQRSSGDVAARFLRETLTANTLNRPESALARRNAVWAASRIGTDAARLAVVAGLEDPQTDVCQAAIRSAGILRERRALDSLQKILLDHKLPWPLRRTAATSLGQIGEAEAVPALLNSVVRGGDNFFRHAVIYALIEIDNFDATSKGLNAASPPVRHASLIALESIDATQLTHSLVSPLLETDDVQLRQAVLNLISEREGWSDEIIAFLQEYTARNKADPSRQASVRGAIFNYSGHERVQEIVAQALLSPDTAAEVRSVLLEGLARVPTLPDRWVDSLRKLLTDEAVPDVIRETLAVLSSSGTSQLDEALRSVAANAKHSDDLRAAVWCCLAARGVAIPDTALTLLGCRVTDPAFGPLERVEAARAIAAAKLSDHQLVAVTKYVKQAGPVELPVVLSAFEKRSSKTIDPAVATALLESLGQSGALETLSRSQLNSLLQGFPERIRQEAGSLTKRLQTGDSSQIERLEQISLELVEGDVRRGRRIFFSSRSACSACHRIAGQGGSIGPDLTRIGSIRKRRDLLEAILFPSATIVNNYETWLAVMTSGRTHSGVIHRATFHSIVLRNAQRTELLLNRNEIAELVRQPNSIMPQGLDRMLTAGELSDLLAFLQSQREAVENSVPE